MGTHKSVVLGSGAPAGGSGPSSSQLPASLGQKTAANSLSVVLASDGENSNGVVATVNKPLTVATYCWSVARSTALEASRVVKASAGNVRSVSARIDSSAATGTFFIQVLDASSLPADGAVTVLDCQKRNHITGFDDEVIFDFTNNCIAFTTGLVIVLSTTEFQKTIAGNFMSTTVLYK